MLGMFIIIWVGHTYILICVFVCFSEMTFKILEVVGFRLCNGKALAGQKSKEFVHDV